jgi:hypothetical protein
MKQTNVIAKNLLLLLCRFGIKIVYTFINKIYAPSKFSVFKIGVQIFV